jgi:hypothetical protein
MKKPITALALAFLASLASSSSSRSDTPFVDAPSTPKTLLAPSATEVVASLEAPIPKGKNAVWCASFLASWKTLAEQMANEPLALKGSGGLVTLLNSTPDPRPAIPKAALCVASGWKQQGIVEQIQKELAQKFPSKELPTFSEAARDSFIAYSYLEASVKFSLPYFQNRQPLEFTDSAGRKNPILSFGIRAEDDYAYAKLRAQPRILFRKGKEYEGNLEFAIDLCPDSKPSQIVIARIKREPTLAEAVARVERESLEMEKLGHRNPDYTEHLRRIGPNDTLLVPNLFWKLSNHFSELEGKTFANTKLKGQRLDVAQQDILFRLDRSGAELKSESKMYCLPIPTHFVLDRPFLVYMSQRGSKTPYLALWIDNAELLSQWPERRGAQPESEAKGSQPTRSETNRTSSAPSSLR